MSSESNSETQRRFSREPQGSDGSPIYNLPHGGPHLPPLRSSHTRRPPAVPGSNGRVRHSRPAPERYYSGERLGFESLYGDSRFEPNDDFWEPLQPPDQTPRDTRRSTASQNALSQTPLDYDSALDEADTQLRAVLERPFSSLLPLSSMQPEPEEPPEESRRVKRRKLDTDHLSSNFQGFRYGKYGQVEPGQLTMELVSCDGGMYSDDGQKYAAENILKNDQTVYCTEGPRCNIVLRHQGATVFTLKELIVKAPRSNFTSPVQEGMVFVSMTSDHLLTRTAQYQIQYSPSRSSSRRIGRETQPLAPIISIRHNDDGTSMTRAQVRARRLYNIGMDDEDNDLRVAQIPSEFNVSPPPFRITTECSDDEADDPAPRGDWRAPNRIGALPFESDSSDEEEGNLNDFSFSGTDYRPRRRRNRSTTTALAEAAEAAQAATQEAVRAVGGELLVPHARFFIERNKSKCTIRFDPPVSGRFILLKMWSPHRDPASNIDIQAVVAKGFAGPRYFPSVELR
ncbi:hypothetical protein F5B20DRAFT_11557 [Whalleya microplaca]|nr:hypothetical protein F5B20DRAFT_11557 [Whalleya microplaca]